MGTTWWAGTFGLGLFILIPSCAKPAVRLEILGPADVNHGIPFHLLVRKVDADQFRGESYSQVARLVTQADKSVLRAEVIYAPGSKPYQGEFSLAPPKEGGVGLYFLFTNPIGAWRVLLAPPLPKTQRITLGVDGIQ